MKVLKKIADRIKLTLGQAILESLDNSGQVQIVKVSRYQDEEFDGVPRIEEYGRTTRPPTDGEVILGSLGGNGEQTMVLKIGYSSQRPVEGEDGDIIDWDIHGNKVHFSETGILITASSGATVNIKQDGNIVLNEGTLDVARKTDSIVSGTEVPGAPNFWEWVSAVNTFIVAASAALGISWIYPNPPTKLDGTITTGNETIKG